MPRYRVSFDMIRYSKGGSKSVAVTSETVEAESEQMAVILATSKVTSKSAYKEYEPHPKKVEKLRS